MKESFCGRDGGLKELYVAFSSNTYKSEERTIVALGGWAFTYEGSDILCKLVTCGAGFGDRGFSGLEVVGPGLEEF